MHICVRRFVKNSYGFAVSCSSLNRSISTTSGFLEDIYERIRSKKAVVVGDSKSSEVSDIVNIFKSCKHDCDVIEVHKHAIEAAGRSLLHNVNLRDATAPYVYVKGDFVGGFNELKALNSSGVLQEWLRDHDYDLVVVGGGSGGLAAAKEAAALGKRVACLDFVKPTPRGTTWGLGGTCVNVGCIPKKLFHHGALLGHNLEDARAYGWEFDKKVKHNWKTMKNAVQEYISSLNFNYRITLRDKNVTYLNAYGKFVGSHTIAAVDKKGQEKRITADRFLIATGLRPRLLNVPGALEHTISSDDIFKLDYSPGKTLVVGASYVALECAGFLHGTGHDVTVMVRSILLRGFDQDIATRIGKHMETVGIKFIRETVPTKIEQIEPGTPGRIKVTAKSKSDEKIVDEYNTVLLAMGRDAVTDGLDLDVIGVKRNDRNKKILCLKNEQSISMPYVYAVGDVLEGGIELTPVAIDAGRLLMRRLYGLSHTLSDYENVPTTVFTPLEYGCCGLSEEQAEEKFGADSVEVFHLQFEPLEFTVPHRKDTKHCYAKLICNKKDKMRVVGFHYLGPNAGEITQGFSIALKVNATKENFDRLIGIHPTCAEVK